VTQDLELRLNCFVPLGTKITHSYKTGRSRAFMSLHS